jgi:hypothetical protein
MELPEAARCRDHRARNVTFAPCKCPVRAFLDIEDSLPGKYLETGQFFQYFAAVAEAGNREISDCGAAMRGLVLSWWLPLNDSDVSEQRPPHAVVPSPGAIDGRSEAEKQAIRLA